MRVFTYEFEVYVKSLLFCSWRGHKEPLRYVDTYWAPGHMGAPAKFCLRCGTKLKTKEFKFRIPKDLYASLKKEGWTNKDLKRGYKVSTVKT